MVISKECLALAATAQPASAQPGKFDPPHRNPCGFWGLIKRPILAFIRNLTLARFPRVPRLTAAHQSDIIGLMSRLKFISSQKAQTSTLTGLSNKPQKLCVY